MKNNSSLERRMSIYASLQEDKKVMVSELAEKFNVTKMTIRRDLATFEKQGLIKTTYGGAYLISGSGIEPSFQLKSGQMADDKSIIAKKAAELVDDGDTIIIDCGTTTLAIAHYLIGKKLTVITNSIPVVNLLKGYDDIQLIVAPGEYDDSSQGMISFSTVEFFGNLHADTVFLSTQGISPKGEMTVPKMADAYVKQSLLQAGKKKVLLADKSKFGDGFLAGHGNLSTLDYVVSQQEIPDAMLSYMSANGVELLVAEESETN